MTLYFLGKYFIILFTRVDIAECFRPISCGKGQAVGQKDRKLKAENLKTEANSHEVG